MKVFNESLDLSLTKDLTQWLLNYRNKRKFNTQLWCEAKAHMFNEYMKKSSLNTAVIAVSGGIDSALVLGLVKHASLKADSPIKKIVAINLPAYHNVGATGQEEAQKRALELCISQGVELLTLNVSPVQDLVVSLAESQLGMKSDNWAKGQIVAYARTPVLYGLTSVLSANGYSAIICGTTNRDEGAYLGYVGKASDGMVDVQLISDLHKSEVYKVSEYLNVPNSIMEVVSTGDMHDSRVDTQVFGASYDFVELYLWYLNLDTEQKNLFKNGLSEEGLNKFKLFSDNLEKLHTYNAHKYLAGSPAVHLDILESNVKGGWQIQKNIWIEGLNKNIPENTKNLEVFKVLKDIQFENKITECVKDIGIAQLQLLENVLPETLVQNILKEVTEKNDVSINENGLYIQNKENTSYAGKSKRLNTYSPEFAHYLWNKIKDSLDPIEEYSEYDYCEIEEKGYWKPVGINPYIKINQYEEGGYLVPHYDGAYQYDDKHKNMKTIIIYLEDCDAKTRIINDNQKDIPYKDRNMKDWTKEVDNQDVLFENISKKNTAFIFDNKLLHDSTSVHKGRKTILLTEIAYERI